MNKQIEEEIDTQTIPKTLNERFEITHQESQQNKSKQEITVQNKTNQAVSKRFPLL